MAGGLLALAGLMLWGVYLGAFHAGIEWGIWTGPQECSGAPQLGPASDLMKRLQTINITRCDEAAWRFLGISLAGYNALISRGARRGRAVGREGRARNVVSAYGSSSVSQ